MPIFRASASVLTNDIEQLVRSNTKTRYWRTNVIPGRENRLTLRVFCPDNDPHQCWVEFAIEESISSSLVNVRMCQSAHESGRVKDHILRELDMRYR